MAGPWDGLQICDPTGKTKLVDYVPNPKQYMAHNCEADEVLFGGALGGGKSFYIDFHNAGHCLKWGPDAKTIMFRRTFDELKRSLVQDMLTLFHGKVGVMQGVDTQPVFKWNNGAITWFRHLENWEDVLKHDSAQYTLACFDELTHFEERQYLYIFQRVRSPNNPNIHCQVISGSNPGGIGHRWVHDRFIKDKEPYTLYRFTERAHPIGGIEVPEAHYSRIFVLAQITDNEFLMQNDPGYIARAGQAMAPDELQAKLHANWEVFSGLVFNEWNPAIHVVDEFPIPKGWPVIRCLDYGYEQPFSVGWLAKDPQTKAIYRIGEWFGAERGPRGGTGGLKMAPTDLRQGIIDREDAYRATNDFGAPWYGVADPSIWKDEGQGCIADLINAGRPLFRAADRNPALRKQTFHSLLRVNPQTGKPSFMSFRRCVEFNEQFPKLVRDSKDPEKLDTRQNDHSVDECGYGVCELVRGGTAKDDPMELRTLRNLARVPVAV